MVRGLLREKGAARGENPVRIVTATSLFDGHDASINIMRRILQASGVEVIHLGHNRSVDEIVDAALQEDAQGVAITSYQGGHVEFLKYMYDLLKERGEKMPAALVLAAPPAVTFASVHKLPKQTSMQDLRQQIKLLSFLKTTIQLIR